MNALEDASLEAIVKKLPMQLNRLVKESGSNFSTGERQLLCLARALLRKNKIIVWMKQRQMWITKFKHCTVITVAHRLNTIMDYNRILVLDHGRVVEYDKPEISL